ncbi:MAG: N-acyl homoserine lactonase family protein [Halieaceae bacterium]|jgi:N-acyl homoserine lactone hydrolase
MRSFKLLFVGLISLFLIACEGGEPAQSQKESVSGPEVTGRELAMQPIKLYIFDCGRLRFASIAGFNLKQTDTDVRELSTPCYVIDHPEGQLLWDAGLPSGLAKQEGWQVQEDGFASILTESLTSQLGRLNLGFDLGSLEYVAFSHIHWDHVGAANDVASGTWLVQQGDYDAAHAEGSLGVPAVQSELLAGIKNRPTQVLNGDHDVFGDGRVRVIAAEGHTPGHQVLYVDLAETGPVILSGDLYHFRYSRKNRVVPVFNVDAEQTLLSMNKVEGLVSASGADFWLQHDAALFDSQKKAPAYYQ